MIRQNYILDLNDELIVDNFAGGGGASTGIEMALGRHVDHAINHDEFALGMHRINHPQTVHHPEDVFAVNPRRLAAGYSSTHPRRPADEAIDPRRVRRIGLGWFSPDCKHFSKAKGGKPLSKKIRGLAFVILRWARVRTRVIYMENVEEIQTWGPLKRMSKGGKRGMYPDPAHKGRTWKAFLAALSTGIDPNHPDLDEMVKVLTDKLDPANSVTREELIKGFGYEFDSREIRACDYGTPTIRKRLFMIARCDGMPIVWPEFTHADRSRKPEAGSRKLKPYVPIASCIDWDIPCHSIFLTPMEAKKVRCRRPLAESTMRRIATGIDRYVLKAKRPFLVSLTHQGSDRVESIDEPAKTLTGAHRGEKALVSPTLMRPAHGDQSKNGKRRGRPAMSVEESLGTQTASNEFALVNSNLAPFITEHANASNQRNVPIDKSLPTQCAEVKGGHFARVDAKLARMWNHGRFHCLKCKTNFGVNDYESNTVTCPKCKNDSIDAIKDFLQDGGAVELSGTIVGAGGPAYAGKPKPVDKAMGTLTTENHSHLASAYMVQKGHYKSNSKMVKGADEPMRTQVANAEHAVAAASMVKLRGDAKTHAPGSPAGEPVGTASADGQHHGVSVAYLAQHNAGFNTTVGHEATEPISTVSAKGSQQNIVDANIVRASGFSHDIGDKADKPSRTLTTKEQFELVQSKLVKTTPGPLTEGDGMKNDAAQQQVVVGSLAAYYGCDEDGQGVDESARTVTTKERFGFVKSKVVSDHRPPLTSDGSQYQLTPEQIAGAQWVAAFLREYGVQFDGEFATITMDGVQWVIVDIGMRMLTARELFRAQGFPESYVIDRAWLIHPFTGEIFEQVLTKEQQIRMCGNSVCPPVAAALVAANSGDLAIWNMKERRSRRKQLQHLSK